jgi:hypothetical protein
MPQTESTPLPCFSPSVTSKKQKQKKRKEKKKRKKRKRKRKDRTREQTEKKGERIQSDCLISVVFVRNFPPIRTSCSKTAITFRSELRFQCSFFPESSRKVLYRSPGIAPGDHWKKSKKCKGSVPAPRSFLHTLASLHW